MPGQSPLFEKSFVDSKWGLVLRLCQIARCGFGVLAWLDALHMF